MIAKPHLALGAAAVAGVLTYRAGAGVVAHIELAGFALAVVAAALTTLIVWRYF